MRGTKVAQSNGVLRHNTGEEKSGIYIPPISTIVATGESRNNFTCGHDG